MKQTGVIIASSLFSALLAVLIYRQVEEPQQVLVKEVVPARWIEYDDHEPLKTASPTMAPPTSVPTNFIEAAALVTPAVVNIKSAQSGDYFWSNNNYNGASFGSGIIVSKDGYIVTNRHVIEDGNKIQVTLSDKRDFTAEIIGTDPSTDLAVLKIKANGLPFVNFGNSDAVQVGEWVLAVGNPFNLESTVTAGIVSAKGRNINILEDQYSIESFIQTDAAVNPGNSGGALVNTRGELVGINTAIITRSGKYEGYSFAVPSNLANKVIMDLKEFGEVQRAILGINIESVDNARAKDLGLPNVEGVYITRITPKGGADEAGLKEGDVILGINDAKVRTVPELQEQVGRYRPGNMVKVDYFRNGRKYQAQIMLRNKNNSVALSVTNHDNLLLNLGFELRELTMTEERKLNVKGVKVISIFRGSKIERTEMDPDYVITKVNDVRVTTVDEVVRELKKAKSKVLLEGFYENYAGEYYYTFAK